MKVIITGFSGFVGQALVAFLKSQGHSVLGIRPETYINQLKTAENYDAVVHLAGENIASKRWTEKRKKELLFSRVHYTHQIIAALKNLKSPPKAFISASGIGIYGRPGRKSEVCNESNPAGEGFLANLAVEWEKATQEAKSLNMRVVNLRFAAILASSGGVLKKMLPSFKLGFGAKFGDGKQHMPWVSLQDVLGYILFSLTHENVNGPLNVIAPEIVTNAEFSKKLAHVLNRPFFLFVPEFVVNLLFGEMGRELFLTDIRATPAKAQKLGYEFIHPNLDSALKYYLNP